MGALAVRSTTDVVNAVAWNFGFNFDDREATSLLWNFTGFPSFFMGEPEACIRLQLWDFFTRQSYGCVPCMCCGADAPPSWQICVPCAARNDAVAAGGVA